MRRVRVGLGVLVTVLLLAPVHADGAQVAHGAPVVRTPVGDVQVRGDAGADRADVRAVTEVGRWVVVGGSFESFVTPDGTTVAQPYLVAYDRRTGRVHPTLRPRLDGRVRSVVADGDDHVLVAGDFFSVDQRQPRRVARFDLRDGTVDRTFLPQPDAHVNDVAVVGDRVVVGGAFGSVGGAPRSRLAAVDRTTGAVDPGFVFDVTEAIAKGLEVRDLDLSPNGVDLLVAHTGRRVAGQVRAGLAMLSFDPRPRLRAWRSDLYDTACRTDNGALDRPWMRAVDYAPDGTWAVAVADNGNYPPGCDTAVRLPTTDPDAGAVEATWISALFDTPEAVAVSDAAVYVGGHFRHVMGPGTTWQDYPSGNDVVGPPGSVPRFQLAALDPATGAAIPGWQSNADGVRGVLALEVTPNGLLAGSDGTRWAGRDIGAHARFERPLPVPQRPVGGPARRKGTTSPAWGR